MPEVLIQRKIKIKEKNATAIELRLPHANLVMVSGEKGFIGCGYLNLATAEKLSDAACLVRGVKTIDDLWEAKIVGLTSFAESLGIKLGMLGKEALELLV
ncbi:MAG: DUF1805 domain-containing protein [Candidatus Omnitrophota bacterium]|nr:DUF1805 domain-containing protein [Candidatus Omnitrophota bacterium]